MKMTKEEKIDKILEMTKEICSLNDINEKELDDLYIQTKLILQALKELNGVPNEEK